MSAQAEQGEVMRQIKRGHREEDEFLTFMQKITKFILRYRDVSIIVGIIIVVGISVLVYTLSSGEKHVPEADILNTNAMGLMSMGRLQDAENILLDLTTRFPNTRSGKVGFYYLGVLYYHTGRFDESLHNFDRFLKSQKDDYLLEPAALFGAGCAAEGLKEYEKALSYYQKIIKDKKSSFYYIGMLSCGRLAGLTGDTERAQEILEELIAQEPPPDIVADARFYIGYFNE